MEEPASLKLPTPDWSSYDHVASARVSHCCLLLMGLRPGPAIRAGVAKWPASSELGKRYNSLLLKCYWAITGGNPLLQPLKGETTTERLEFQRLPLSLAHFAALARSDLSPFAHTLQEQLPEGFENLKPPVPLGSRASNELLSELRATYATSNSPEDHEQLNVPGESEKLDRKDKQLALYTGVLLHWVYETRSKQNWLWGAALNASAIEADLLTWLRDRAVHSSDAPQEGTMRRYLGMAAKTFDDTYKLKSS
ncbi:hypothetical protein VCH24_63770 [Variovorax boronicumulans]|nr:hypothetical protein VCH24_63770 [Variovorax boronicumulans]